MAQPGGLPRDGNLEREVAFLQTRIAWESKGRFWTKMTPAIRAGLKQGMTTRRALAAIAHCNRACELPAQDLRRWALLNL